eukprot:7336610-Pyramimonas_sp.AAC.1
MRRQAFSTVKPSSKWRSLTAASILTHAGALLCAPLPRWGEEIWLAQIRVHPFSIQLPDLRSSWQSVFALPYVAWSSFRGPLSALRLTLVRLGWVMNNYIMIADDR